MNTETVTVLKSNLNQKVSSTTAMLREGLCHAE